MKLLITYSIMFSILFAACSTSYEQQVKMCVLSQLKNYPKSTLQDIYKNFFQDYFGAEHAIADTTAALQWLESELATFNQSNNPDIEILGVNHRYVRVNLSLVKQGKITKQQLLEAFIKSAKKNDDAAIVQWHLKWHKIVGIIQNMNLHISDFEKDKNKIDTMLQEGKYAIHHSEIFNATYQPHYRIVEKTIFAEILQSSL